MPTAPNTYKHRPGQEANHYLRRCGLNQPNAIVGDRSRCFALEAPLLQRLAKLGLGHYLDTIPLRPPLVVVVQRGRIRAFAIAYHTTLVDPPLEHIHLVLVLVRRHEHVDGRVEALLQPLEAASNSPGENAGIFRAQLFIEALILLMLRDDDSQRDQHDAPPDGVLLSPNDGLVVGCQPELERRLVFKELAIHEARSDRVLPGESLHQHFGEATAVFGLASGNIARSAKASDIVWD